MFTLSGKGSEHGWKLLSQQVFWLLFPTVLEMMRGSKEQNIMAVKVGKDFSKTETNYPQAVSEGWGEEVCE